MQAVPSSWPGPLLALCMQFRLPPSPEQLAFTLGGGPYECLRARVYLMTASSALTQLRPASAASLALGRCPDLCSCQS